MDTLSIGVEDEFGNRHILVLIDSCSRWVELFPIKDLEPSTAASKLIEHFGRFGQPAEIRSDNGTQFVNKLHDELFRLSGVQHLRTIPHSSESNAIVERANKEVLKHLRNILFDDKLSSEWNRAIPFVQRIMNSERSSVTGAKPSEIILGQISLDRGIFCNVG